MPSVEFNGEVFEYEPRVTLHWEPPHTIVKTVRKCEDGVWKMVVVKERVPGDWKKSKKYVPYKVDLGVQGWWAEMSRTVVRLRHKRGVDVSSSSMRVRGAKPDGTCETIRI